MNSVVPLNPRMLFIILPLESLKPLSLPESGTVSVHILAPTCAMRLTEAQSRELLRTHGAYVTEACEHGAIANPDEDSLSLC